jgi:predicted DNA-binding protein with PD1-like motif
MRFCEAERGRVFIIRLEHGEIIHDTIEQFCREQGVTTARVTILGGADRGSRLVVGPKNGETMPPNPTETTLDEVHEIAGVGTIVADESGVPILHMHVACGRNETTITGCVRTGVRIWHVAEVVLEELTGSTALRKKDPVTGFKLLEPR